MSAHDRTIEQLIKDLHQAEREISELKKHVAHQQKDTDALHQERELYADLANALPAGIYRTRVFHAVSTNDEEWLSSIDAPYRIEFANNRFYEILHLDRADIEKNPGIINNLIFEADKAEFVRKNVEANLHRTPFTWEGRFTITENPIWIHFESIPRYLENGDIIWTGTLHDISKRKNEEREIAFKNLELQKLNAEKEKFFSIIAHDLKSPFTAILGFSQLLIEASNNKELEKIEKFAHIILQSSTRAVDLLKNLMEWAQSHTGRMEYSPEYFDIVTLINETTLLYDDIAGQKSITIKKVLPHHVSLFADKAMICSVFRNLISNAIKFTMPGGEVTIWAEEQPDEMLFSVEDRGVGIPQCRLETIFQSDHATSTSGTQNEKGTGLGLTLCKEFVEKHGGKIWAQSHEKEGSTFYFTLPRTHTGENGTC